MFYSYFNAQFLDCNDNGSPLGTRIHTCLFSFHGTYDMIQGGAQDLCTDIGISDNYEFEQNVLRLSLLFTVDEFFFVYCHLAIPRSQAEL